MKMPALLLRYLGHRTGADLAYFTGDGVDLVPGQGFAVRAEGLIIGRRAGADVRIASSWVAPRHARLTQVAEGVVVADLGSTNGTAINGVAIDLGLLRVGDTLTIAGGFDFTLSALASSGDAPDGDAP